MASEARVIDLGEYRRRRGQQSSAVPTASVYGGAGMFTAAMAWYPVMVWVPFWAVY